MGAEVTPPCPHRAGFSLVEVVMALGITVFCIVVIIGLLSVTMRTNRDSVDLSEAASTASKMLTVRRMAPVGTNALTGTISIPPLDQAWPVDPEIVYVSRDGTVTNSSDAAFRATIRAGTNSYTGPKAANIYLSLVWPANAGSIPPNQYEVFTTVSW